MALARIESNIRKMQAQGANEGQIREYVALEKARGSGRDADTAFLRVMDSGSDIAPIAEFAGSVAKEIKENPVKTAGGIVGGVGGAIGGTALGGPAGGVVGGATGAAGGEAVGESIDNLLFNRQSRTLGERGTSAAITTGLGVVAPVIGGTIQRALSPAAPSAVQAAAKTLSRETKGVSEAFKNVLGKSTDKLSLVAEQTALSGTPQGVGLAKGAVQAERAAKIFSDAPTDAAKKIAERREIIRQAVTGGIPKKDIAKTTSEFAEQATKAKDNLAKIQRETTSVFATSKPTREASISAKEINGILSDPKLAGALKAAGGSGAVDEFRKAISIPLTTSGPKGRAIVYVPTERDITDAITNLVQVAGRNPQVEAVFWRDTYENGIKPLLDSKNDELSKTLAKQFEQRFALFRAREPLGKKLYDGDISFVVDALSTSQNFDDAMKVWKDAAISSDFKVFAKNAILAQVSSPDGTVVSSKVKDFLAKTDPKTLERALGKGYYQKLKDVGTTTAAIEAAGVESRIKGAAKGLDAEPTFRERGQEFIAAGLGSQVIGGSQALSLGARAAAVGQTLFRGALGQGNSFADATVDSFLKEAVKSKAARETYPAYTALAASLGTPVIGIAEYESKLNEIKDLEQASAAAGARIPEAVKEAPTEFDFQKELESIRSGDKESSSGETFDFQKELDAIRGKQESQVDLSGQGGPEATAPSMGGERDLSALMNTGNPSPEMMKIINEQKDPMGALLNYLDTKPDESDIGKLVAVLDPNSDFDNLVRTQMKEELPAVTKKLTTAAEEGFSTRVYKDTKGFKTVGVGFNMEAAGARKLWQQAGIKAKFDDVLTGKAKITKADADKLYSVTKAIAIQGAKKLVKNFDSLGAHQKDALADMVFQLGVQGAMGFKRMRAAIERGDMKAAAAEMMSSANARQTRNRVLRRAYMFENNVSLSEANSALIKNKKIAAKDSIG